MNGTFRLPRCTPEDQGGCSAAVLSFIHEIERRKLELHGFMFLRGGHVITEGWWAPYGPEYPHIANSLTKSFTSTAAGFAVQEGLITVDDLVLPYFPDIVNEEILVNMGGLKIKHLLSMSTGHMEDTTRFGIEPAFLEDRPDLWIGDRADRDWVRGFFELPIEQKPGTSFVYNSGASQVLAEIVQQVTGQSLVDYLHPRLFEPLGIEKPQWDTWQKGTNCGGWGLRLKTEDIARFGLLFLRKGVWNGKRILTEEWVSAATAKQVDTQTHGARMGVTGSTDWMQGYGYQFWMCQHDAYRGDGAFGQYCLVIPDHDAVIAINSGIYDMQELLDVIWEHLLPAMKAGAAESDEASRQLLARKLSDLALGEPDAKLSNPMNGSKCYKLEANEDGVEEITFDFEGDECSFAWRDQVQERSISFRCGSWSACNRLADEQVAAKGTWRDERTLVIDLFRIQTPYHDKLTCMFEGKHVIVTHEHPDFVARNRRLTGILRESGE
ncbi:serine hydrolase domain-containing protein [Paenibacillaceae bacterium WGS1546]|uniref:serine hydrolase domain-containing protein n=1 Tax=Cohnella sp. WGS1546 TaxID=3366810 RepID=UPI00372D5F0F